LLRPAHRHGHAVRHGEGRLQPEVVQVRDAAGDAVRADGQRFGRVFHRAGRAAVPHELRAENLAAVACRLEGEGRDGGPLGHRHVAGIVGQRERESVASVGGKVCQRRAGELGFEPARQDGDVDFIALPDVRGAGDVAGV